MDEKDNGRAIQFNLEETAFLTAVKQLIIQKQPIYNGKRRGNL